ncbi:MAG: hypothetical protein ACKOC5_02705 [Chloroflexota bacterium]
MFRNMKVLFIALLALVIAGGAYAFAAANVVPDSAGGYKANTVSGYTITNIIYDLDNADPTTLDAITFDVSPTSGSVKAATVKVQLANAGTWTDCTLADGTLPAVHVTCTYGSLAFDQVTALNIVASGSADPTPNP